MNVMTQNLPCPEPCRAPRLGGQGEEAGAALLQISCNKGNRVRDKAGVGLAYEGQGLSGQYSLHKTVSSRENPRGGDEGAPADVAPALMQAHLPRPGSWLGV